MIIYDVVMAFFVMVFVFVGLSAAQDIKVQKCQQLCTKPLRPVCGSDNQTYLSRCHLRCNPAVIPRHRGRCRTTSVSGSSNCLLDKAYALRHHKTGGYVPSCRADGSYASVQCHQDSNFCWCVDRKGRSAKKNSIKYVGGKPRCHMYAKSTTKRRSSNSRNRRPKRGCKRADKALFNNNLIDIFQTEYIRIHSAGNMQGGELDRAVLDWKFRDMDYDRSGALDKTEYRELRKLVKKVVRPKRCSKTFAKACDVNRDQQITREEWGECLTRDGMDDERGGGNGGRRRGHDHDDRDEEEDYGDEGEEEEEFFHHPPRKPPIHEMLQSPVVSSLAGLGEESGERGREDDATDCLSDRQAVLNEHRAENMYVPECTPDGRYKKIQCYKSVGYCWCVHEDTGKNIPGTSVQNAVPQCEQLPAPARPMRGCPDRARFLTELRTFLHSRMLAATNDTNITGYGSEGGIGSWAVASSDEKAATWNFVVLDKNKNKVLERREWKTFRALVSTAGGQWRPLRRCGKKLPRYCDVNHDRRISMTEWLDCLEANRKPSLHHHSSFTPNQDQHNVSSKTPTQTRRRGPNPLESYLKDDD